MIMQSRAQFPYTPTPAEALADALGRLALATSAAISAAEDANRPDMIATLNKVAKIVCETIEGTTHAE
jgi:hypothetical protein